MRVVICDGQKNEAVAIQHHLMSIAADRGVDVQVTVLSSIDSLLFHMEDQIHLVDLLLMEVDYEDTAGGIEAAKKLRDMGYSQELIFVTANRDMVFHSFDASPFHYILKGETEREKVDQIFRQVLEKAGNRRKEMLSLTCAGERRNVPIDEIRYFEVDKRIIRVHYGADNQVFEFYSTIGKLENMLLDKGILRVHRAFLVAVAHVTAIGGGEITLDVGEKIPLGRTYAKSFRERYLKDMAPEEGAALRFAQDK